MSTSNCRTGNGKFTSWTQSKHWTSNRGKCITKDTYLKNIKPNIPFTYNDGIDPETINPNYDNKLEKFHNSYLHIVTETNFSNTQLFLSEKIFKPIVHYQPFVVVGNPGSISLLHSLGYRTFNNYIDESYDSEKDNYKRLYKVYNSIKDFIDRSPQELTELMIDMKPIFKHNLSNLLNRSSASSFNEVKAKLTRLLYNYNNII